MTAHAMRHASFAFARHTPQKRLALILAVMLTLLAAAVVIAIGTGSTFIAPETVIQILTRHLNLSWIPFSDEIANGQITIVEQVRLPRVLCALMIGASMAAAGVVMQGVFRNPLADPGILGVSTGGSVGAVIAFYTGLSLHGMWIVPIFAFVGSLSTALLVYLVSLERGRANTTTLILSGTAFNAFLGAITSAILLMTQDVAQAQLILTWLVGGLAGRGWRQLAVMILPQLAVMIAFLLYTRDLNAFLLGEETAQGIGTNVPRTRLLLLTLTALITGVSVSMTGPIGFIGLVVPHFLRLIIGPDNRVLLPASMVGGAIFLVLADMVTRLLIAYQEIPVGVITGLLGGPFFLLLLWRLRSQVQGL